MDGQASAGTYQISNIRPADDYSSEENYKLKHEEQDYPEIYENQEEGGGSIESAYELLEKTFLKDSQHPDRGAYIAIHKRPPPHKKQATGDKVAVIIKQVGHRPAVDEYGRKTNERHGYLLVPVMSKLSHSEMSSGEDKSVQDDQIESYTEVSKPEVHQELEESEEYHHQEVDHQGYPKVGNYFHSEEDDSENQDHQTSVPVLIPTKDIANMEVDTKGRYIRKMPPKFKLPLKKPIILTAHGGAPPVQYMQKKPRKHIIGVPPSNIANYAPIIIATKKTVAPSKRYKSKTPIVLTTQYRHDGPKLNNYGKYKKESVPVHQSLPLRSRGLWKSPSYRPKSVAVYPSRSQYPQPRVQRKVKPIQTYTPGGQVFRFKSGDLELTGLESALGIPKRRRLEKILYDLNTPVMKYPVIHHAKDLGQFF